MEYRNDCKICKTPLFTNESKTEGVCNHCKGDVKLYTIPHDMNDNELYSLYIFLYNYFRDDKKSYMKQNYEKSDVTEAE